jgi:hypothetical protein
MGMQTSHQVIIYLVLNVLFSYLTCFFNAFLSYLTCSLNALKGFLIKQLFYHLIAWLNMP